MMRCSAPAVSWFWSAMVLSASSSRSAMKVSLKTPGRKTRRLSRPEAALSQAQEVYMSNTILPPGGTSLCPMKAIPACTVRVS